MSSRAGLLGAARHARYSYATPRYASTTHVLRKYYARTSPGVSGLRTRVISPSISTTFSCPSSRATVPIGRTRTATSTPCGGCTLRSCSMSSAADCLASNAPLAAPAETAPAERAAAAGFPAEGRLAVAVAVAVAGGCLARSLLGALAFGGVPVDRRPPGGVRDGRRPGEAGWGEMGGDLTGRAAGAFCAGRASGDFCALRFSCRSWPTAASVSSRPIGSAATGFVAPWGARLPAALLFGGGVPLRPLAALLAIGLAGLSKGAERGGMVAARRRQ